MALFCCCRGIAGGILGQVEIMSHYISLCSSVLFLKFLFKEIYCFYRFSEVFHSVSKNTHDDIFYEDDIWPELDQNG